MSYILVEIDSGGYIRCADDKTRYGKKVVHKESVNLNKLEGIRVFDDLKTAKVYWSGPDTDEAILNLDDAGAGANIWIAEKQHERLTDRLKRWSGCYGNWPVRRLND